MPEPQVFIAGIGLSSSSTWASSTTTRDGFEELALSAAIKALLDAGITYDKVTHGIGCVNDAGTRVGDKPFYALGATGIPICEVDSDAGLYTAASLIRGNGAGCVLLIGPDEAVAAAVVVVSDHFIWRHPYLKDSAALFQEYVVEGSNLSPSRSTASRLKTRPAASDKDGTPQLHGGQEIFKNQGRTLGSAHMTASRSGFTGLCELVWALRGWSHAQRKGDEVLYLHDMNEAGGRPSASILCRADGKIAPDWEDIEHKNDGRQRLGYNPASESRQTFLEDWIAVKSREEYTQRRIADHLPFPRKGGDRAALARL